MTTSIKALALMTAFGVCAIQQSKANAIGVDLGTGAPPTTLGGYTVSAYDPGSIGGAAGVAHETGGNYDGGGTTAWATWGQGYTGNVYVSSAGSTALTLFLSGGVEAVYFYMEPNTFANFTMTAVDSSGATVSTVINGNHGSSGVGFYESLAGGPDYLTKISVTCSDPTGFAIGEFGISTGGQLGGQIGTSVPDGGSTLALLGFGFTGLMGMAKFRRSRAA